jgi:hypothetical protein
MIHELIRFAEMRLARLNQQRSEAIDFALAARLDADIADVEDALTKLRALV